MSKNFVTRTECPACRSASFAPLLSLPFTDERIWQFLQHHFDGQIPREKVETAVYSVAECHRCGLLFQVNILDDAHMALLYEQWILAEKSLDKKRFADERLFRGYAFELAQVGRRFAKPPREVSILEYGMGWGYWARMAQAFNFDVIGVEISESRINYAQALGVTAVSTLDQLQNKRFDYIYANQVFEHLPAPAETLNQLASFLKPQGVIHIQVPNGRLTKKQLQDPNWQAQKSAIHPLEHINSFTLKSWQIMATEAGVRVEKPRFQPRFTGIKPFMGSLLKYAQSFSSPYELFLGCVDTSLKE